MKRNSLKRFRGSRKKRVGRGLMIAFIALMVVGIFAQIAMISRLHGQNKEIRAVEKEIRELNATAENLNLGLNQYGSLERVALLAEKLGMQKPDEGQIRVVNLPDVLEDTPAQNAANTGAEESNE